MSVFTVSFDFCLPVWQVVPGSPDVSLTGVPSFLPVCLLRPALWMPLLNSCYLFPVVWLAFWLVVSGSLDVSLHLSPTVVVSGSPDV